MNKRDSWMKLVSRFALRPIRTERQYDLAVKVMEKLAVRDESSLDKGESDYLDVLANLIDEYDEAHHPIDTAGTDPVGTIQYLMSGRGMTASDLGRVLGNRSLGSKVLNRQRQLSMANVLALSRHFGIGPGAFIKDIVKHQPRLRRAG